MANIDYVAANAAFRKFKSALTRAKNQKDHAKVVVVVNEFFEFFDSRDWALPDDWRRFDIARSDARLVLRRESTDRAEPATCARCGRVFQGICICRG
jgi:hypothetical protein